MSNPRKSQERPTQTRNEAYPAPVAMLSRGNGRAHYTEEPVPTFIPPQTTTDLEDTEPNVPLEPYNTLSRLFGTKNTD
jgi:hypothetical protein